MHGRSILFFAALVGLLVGSWAEPTPATNESQAAILGLLYRPGGREMALGGAGVASAKGSMASYYNPALLSWQNDAEGDFRRSVGSTYYKILADFGLNDMYYMYFPVMFNVEDWGQFSVNVTYLSLGEQIETDEGGNELGTFHTYTLVMGLSYSAMIARNTSAGITAKFFYDHLAKRGQGWEKGDPTGTGFAVDVGIIHRMSERLVFGAALRNYGPNVQYIDADQASPTPINFNLGAMWKAIDTEYNDITLVADLYKPLVQDMHKSWFLAPIHGWTDEDLYKREIIDHGAAGKDTVYHRSTIREEGRQVDIHAGVEYAYAEYVAIRGGFYRDWDGKRRWLTFGAGFRLPISSASLMVDFGYVHALGDGDTADPNNGQQVYTVSITF